MNQTPTPFDDNLSPQQFPAFQPASSPDFPPAPVKRKKPWWPWALLGLSVLLVVGGFAVRWNAQQAAEREKQAQLASQREKLNAIVRDDNALTLAILEIDSSSNLTYAEYFKRTEKNKEERDELIRRTRALDVDTYAKIVADYVKLMELENEWVRAEEALSRQTIEWNEKNEAAQNALNARDESTQKLSAATREYYDAPYGEDYGEKISMELAQSRVQSSSAQIETVAGELTSARQILREKMASASLAADDWMRDEKRLYPTFAPARDIMPFLIKRKAKYRVAEKSFGGSASTSVVKAAPDTKNAVSEAALKAAPTSTPAPSTPTRLRSTETFPGERFPETRLHELGAEEVSQLADEDLRYAINEMFARYGMTFKDKSYQSNFESYKWYRPNDAWTMGQIERAFTPDEKSNLRILTQERAFRQSAQ